MGAESKRVLVVEDEPACRNVLRFTLEHAGFEVTVARDGQAAWQLLNEHDFDLVLTDLAMPRMTGEELLDRMRKEDRLAQLPVIFLTGRDSHVNPAWCDGETGVSAVIYKPFSPREVRKRIEECLATEAA